MTINKCTPYCDVHAPLMGPIQGRTGSKKPTEQTSFKGPQKKRKTMYVPVRMPEVHIFREC